VKKIDGLETFHPDRIASRILGMGDVLSLIEDVEKKVDKQKPRSWRARSSVGNALTWKISASSCSR